MHHTGQLPAVIWLLAGLTLLLALLSSGLAFAEAGVIHNVIHDAFSPLCHQFKSRTIHLGEKSMAVCSRCFGIYSGFALGAFTGIFTRRCIQIKLGAVLIIFGFMALLNVVDVTGNFFGIWTNTLTSRYLAGLLAGASFIMIIFPALHYHQQRKN